MKKSLQKYCSILLFSLLCLVQWQGFAEENSKVLAPTVTLTTESRASADISITNKNHVIYILKIVSTEAFILNAISFKVEGSFLIGNIESAKVNTGPTMTSNTQIANIVTTSVASGGNINFTGLSQSIPANSERFIFLTINLSVNTLAGKTIKVNGSANPVILTSTASSLTITNSQTDIAGLFTTSFASIHISGSNIGVNTPVGQTCSSTQLSLINGTYSFDGYFNGVPQFSSTNLGVNSNGGAICIGPTIYTSTNNKYYIRKSTAILWEVGVYLQPSNNFAPLAFLQAAQFDIYILNVVLVLAELFLVQIALIPHYV